MPEPFYEQRNERSLPADYAGDILLWDIDKTYLETRFSSLRGLASIPLEFAVDKLTVPGAVPLLRALRHGPAERSAIVPLYFVSGSPKQLRSVLERRMLIDGVEHDGMTFKDQFGLLLRGQPGRIAEQVGYKVSALLGYQAQIPASARWLLFGDDVESDADAFGLFGEICAGLRGAALDRRLRALGVRAGECARVQALAEAVSPGEDPVARIFIRRVRGRALDPAQHPKVAICSSYLQTAALLAEMHRVRGEAISAVAAEMRARGISPATLIAELLDARDRLGLGADTTERCRALIRQPPTRFHR